MTETIKESFSWLAPEAFKTQDVGKNTVRIRGVALKSNIVSKNQRKYVDEELKKSARTLTGKPLNLNHNNKDIIGNVEWCEYEDGLLEYMAVVKKQPYVDMIRSNDKKVKGVSVQAGYLYNKCAKCGKRFYTEEEFKHHMEKDELLKNFEMEPHGIIYDALSLVVSPEVPGVEGTTTELWETLQKSSALQLLETVTQVKIEEENYMENKQKLPVGIRTEHVISPPIGKQQVKEQDEEPEVHTCPEGEHWDPEQEKCVPDTPPEATEQEEHSCPEGEVWSEEEGKCVVKPEATEQEEHQCGEGEHWSEDKQACVPDEPPAATEQAEPVEPPPCAEGFHLDKDTNQCVPDQPSAVEVKLPKTLRLGEPFADYTDFDDCVAKNQGKVDNPEAYCATIKRKVEGETVKELAETANVYEQLKAVSTRLEEYHQKGVVRDIKQAETLNKLLESLRKALPAIQANNTKQAINLVKYTRNQTLKTLEALASQKIAGKNELQKATTKLSTSFAESISKSNKTISEQLHKISVAQEQLGKNFTGQTQKLTESQSQLEKNFNEQIGKVSIAQEESSKKLESRITETAEKTATDYATKVEFDTVVKAAEEFRTTAQKQLDEQAKQIEEQDKQLKEKDDKITEVTKKLDDKDKLQAKETQDIKKRQDNVEDKLEKIKGFKAHGGGEGNEKKKAVIEVNPLTGK